MGYLGTYTEHHFFSTYGPPRIGPLAPADVVPGDTLYYQAGGWLTTWGLNGSELVIWKPCLADGDALGTLPVV